MESKFFTFIRPYLACLDSGDFYRKPFGWLYFLIAVLNLNFPVYLLLQAIDLGVFDAPAKTLMVFVLVWLILFFAGWVSFQIWWDRRLQVVETSAPGDDFVATPAYCHFIKTVGEWAGTWIGIVGFFVALLLRLSLESEEGKLLNEILPLAELGTIQIFLMPVAGFLIVVSTKFITEQSAALAAIANNTGKK
jgi:hypothetical protein